MKINQALFLQNNSSDTKDKNPSNVNKIFDSLLSQNGDDVEITLEESDLKELSFQEVKELKIKLQDSGYLVNLSEDIIKESSFLSSGLLKTITFTYDEEFNKSLFNEMKNKEDSNLFLEEITHNIEHSNGKKEHPWFIYPEDESYENYSPSTTNEIKATNIKEFLDKSIKSYEKLLSDPNNTHDVDEIKQSINNLKNLQKSYISIDNEKSALLSTMMRVSRPNPLLGKF